MPIAIPLLLAVPAGVWFAGTRGVDFVTAPDAAQLESVARDAQARLLLAEMPLPAYAALNDEVDRKPPQRIQTRRPAHLTAEDRNPPLDTFAHLGPKGARHMIDLSRIAEKAGDRRRALLGWERVLDTCRHDSKHLAAALEAVKRLRTEAPPWSAANRPLPVVIQLSGPEARGEVLAEALARLEKDLVTASHGVLAPVGKLILIKPEPPKPAPKPVKGKTRVTRPVRTPVPPVTLAFSGPGDDPRATAKFTLTLSSTATATAAYDELLRQTWRLVTTTLNQNKDRRTITGPDKNETTLDALSFRVTRWRWHELASSLNRPKDPPAP